LIDWLVKESRPGRSGKDIWQSSKIKIDDADLPDVINRITKRPDLSSVNLLMVLRNSQPKAYAKIKDEIKAKILLDHLKACTFGDDWSLLVEDRLFNIRPKKKSDPPQGSVDNLAGKALLELAPDLVLQGLLEVLQDETEISYAGSAETTQAFFDVVRRCDLAYRYICILKKIPFKYSNSVKMRDRGIEQLMKQLDVKPRRPFEGREYKERKLP
jgi:hypothetical protein